MTVININLGCGPVFVDSPEWINLDYSPSAPTVRKANLLGRLPLEDATASVVYSSHFFEHVPRPIVPGLLGECFRILKPGGYVRFVLPDMENMVREYTRMRERGEHEKADFVVLEMIDQCVRSVPGGELGRLYSKLKQAPVAQLDLINFICERTGENQHAGSSVAQMPYRGGMGIIRLMQRGRGRAERVWTQAVLRLLPKAFRTQNVSLAGVGERHHWLWDFHQLQQELEVAGFTGVQRRTSDSSAITDFPFRPLDIDVDGRPRKGAESMYVEAFRPG